MGRRLTIVAAASAAALTGCSQEARSLASAQPLSSPTSATDPRIRYYQENSYEISQGGRYFTWYGCGGCHGGKATGWLSLRDGQWRSGGDFDQVYHSIADRHGRLAYGTKLPEQQLWQITAYVRDMGEEKPEKLIRQDRDQQGEPTASSWTGPIQ